MMKAVFRSILVTGLCFSAEPGIAAKDYMRISKGELPRDVLTGDPLRKTLLDALRPTIEKDLGQPVKFVVRKLRKQNQWAFAVVVPQKPDGKPVDFMRTRYADYIREGTFDSHDVYALLEQKDRRWIVQDFVIGPTDVYYAGWPDKFGAPYPLFEMPVPEG